MAKNEVVDVVDEEQAAADTKVEATAKTKKTGSRKKKETVEQTLDIAAAIAAQGGDVLTPEDNGEEPPVLFDEEEEEKDSTPAAVAEAKPVVKKEAVKVISDADLNEIKNNVVFRMGEGTNDKYSFSKVCNISRQEKDTILVILYLNEHNVDRSTETAKFTECTQDTFLAPINGVLVDMSLIEKYNVSCKYFVRGTHFGKIVVSLSK